MGHTVKAFGTKSLIVVLATLTLVGAACSSSRSGGAIDAGPAGLSPCIANWPTAGRAPQQRASLVMGSAKILWSRKVPSTAMYAPGYLFDNSGLVLSKGRLVFATHGPLVLIDKAGGLASSEPTSSGSDWDSPATVDEEGNLYSVALSGVYSFDATGKKRWRLGTTNQTGYEFIDFYPPALEPDGVLYAACADGYLRAIGTDDGHEIWRQSVDGVSQVMGGAGEAVFVLKGSRGVHAYDRTTGAHLGQFSDSKYSELHTSLGMWALGWDFEVQFGAIDSFDVCGRMRWSTRRDELYADLSGIIAFNERLVATKWDLDSNGVRLTPDQMYLYVADGSVVKGPVAAEGEPYLAGADGTIYTVNCPNSSPKVNQLIAYTSDLEEMWRLDLGKPDNCPIGNGVLDDDGVLYLARAISGDVGAEILAIQTSSPGLAESSWPSLRHDNRGTMWLTPLPPSPASDEAGDGSVQAAVDATVDAPEE